MNTALWDAQSDAYQREVGPLWERHPCSWGAYFVPDRDLGAIGDVNGRDVLELGCGGARWSIALAKRGGRCVGIDPSQRQLHHAAKLVAASGQSVALHRARASKLPFAPDSFDLVFCDHGGLTYDDPARVLAECARVLRSGGRLVFNTSSPWAEVCAQAGDGRIGQTLQRSYFGLGRVRDDDGVTWVLPYGVWIDLLRKNGFRVDALHELRPDPETAEPSSEHWARHWPTEMLWCVTRD